jgi:aryl-alcohol dehydrogenase-like predicted oxidoreductase
MESRAFGTTGLQVPAIGFGAMQMGAPDFPDAQAAQLLNRVLDLGIGLIDTARAYGESEARIGRHIAHRRDEFVLSTKVGYGIEGCTDWTYGCVARGIDAARDRLRTDRIDIVHLHSCPVEIMLGHGVLDALEAARLAGKLVSVAYSGDNDALRAALDCGRVQSVQASVSLVDQANIQRHLPLAGQAGIGVIAKRALAGAPWRAGERAPPEREYRRRFLAMAEDLPRDADWSAVAIRYSAFAPGVHCALIGTTQIGHLEANLRAVETGPLDPELSAALAMAYGRHGAAWDSVV